MQTFPYLSVNLEIARSLELTSRFTRLFVATWLSDQVDPLYSPLKKKLNEPHRSAGCIRNLGSYGISCRKAGAIVYIIAFAEIQSIIANNSNRLSLTLSSQAGCRLQLVQNLLLKEKVLMHIPKISALICALTTFNY